MFFGDFHGLHNKKITAGGRSRSGRLARLVSACLMSLCFVLSSYFSPLKRYRVSYYTVPFVFTPSASDSTLTTNAANCSVNSYGVGGVCTGNLPADNSYFTYDLGALTFLYPIPFTTKNLDSLSLSFRMNFDWNVTDLGTSCGYIYLHRGSQYASYPLNLSHFVGSSYGNRNSFKYISSSLSSSPYLDVSGWTIDYIIFSGVGKNTGNPNKLKFSIMVGSSSSLAASQPVSDSSALSELQSIDSIVNQTHDYLDGNATTSASVSSADGLNSDIGGAVSEYDGLEQNFTDDFESAQGAVSDDFKGWAWTGLSSGVKWISEWLQKFYNSIGDFKQFLTFPLLLGVALVFLGRWGSVSRSRRAHIARASKKSGDT